MDTAKLVHSLIPELKLASHPAHAIWKQNEKRAFLIGTRLLLAFGLLAYIAHYHFVDLKLGKTSNLWLYYRYGMAALYAVVFAAYSLPRVQQAAWFKVPWLLVGLLSAYLQAQTVVWSKTVPNYDPTVAIIAALAFSAMLAVSLRKNIPTTVSIMLLMIYVQWPALSAAGYQQGYLISLTILALLLAMMSRAKMASDIAALLANSNAMRAEKEAIESQMELYNQTKALLPQEIFERIQRYRRVQHMTALQAIDEVLRPREKKIVCIYSDIRSYTSRTKKEADFISKGVLPNTKNCTEVVEYYRGIPRLIGDLILTYFDHDNAEENIVLALKAAKGLVEASQTLNTLPSEFAYIERYAIVTFGQAIVGNLGSLNSSVEITCMGDPVNLGARIDELTKDANLKPYLQTACIVLSQDAAHAASFVMRNLDIKSLSLEVIGLRIRDYEEEQMLCLIGLDDWNCRIIEDYQLVDSYDPEQMSLDTYELTSVG